MPDSVITIGDMAFDYFSNLRKMKIGTGITNSWESLNEDDLIKALADFFWLKFSGCINLEEITIFNETYKIK